MFKINSARSQAYLYMHLSILLWGLTGVLGRGIQLQEGLLVWYRMIITAISMYFFLKFRKQSIKIDFKDFLKLAGIGAILTVHWLFFYGSIKYSNVSITLSMLASQGLFTAIIEPLIYRKKFRWDELVFSATAMIGIWLVFSVEKVYTIGIILGLSASFVGAFFNILNKDIVQKHSPLLISFYEISTGLLFLTLFLPIYIQVFHPAKLVPTITDWTLLLILAVFCTHLTLALSLAALRHLSAFTLNLSLNLEPIYGIALAFLFFKENKQLNPGFFAGAAIIMLSVLLEAYFQNKKASINDEG